MIGSGYRATGKKVLEDRIMNSSVPKTESERWAARHIKEQEAELQRWRDSRDGVMLTLQENNAKMLEIKAENKRLRNALELIIAGANEYTKAEVCIAQVALEAHND